MLVFEERGKPEYPEKNLSQQGREPTRVTRVRGMTRMTGITNMTRVTG